MYLFYKRINRKYEECENCGKTGSRVMVVRWVEPNEYSYVAGHNACPAFYCSLQCAKENEGEGEFIQVRENTISEINGLGYPA